MKEDIMKRATIYLFAVMILTCVVNAQVYDKFKLGLGAGFAYGKSKTYSYQHGGFLLTLEPAYRLSDNLAIGLRLEATALYTSDIYSLQGYVSTTINGQYYLNTDPVRLFIGAGLGIYAYNETAFGFYPRFGFDYGHFTIALEYNFIPVGSSRYNYLTNSYITSSTYYLGVRIGGFIFGGKN